MQYHKNGYQPGSPKSRLLFGERRRSATEDHVREVPRWHLSVGRGGERQDHGVKACVPEEVDVLIVGSGPTGLTLAAQLSVFSESIATAVTEKRSGRLTAGQADGVACRTVEMFQAFGFADKVLKEACWIKVMAFWRTGSQGGIERAVRIADVEPDVSEFPHVILNQARVQDLYLDHVLRKKAMEPLYGLEFVGVTRDDGRGEYPLEATLRRVAGDDDDGATGVRGVGVEEAKVRCKYLVGCDGARSQVRKSMGLTLKGESAKCAWGVMDLLAVTDFPDVRRKCLIQSDAGAVIIIPREGLYMFRVYVELEPELDIHAVTLDCLLSKANAVLRPYSIQPPKEVVWWSVYKSGARLADFCDDSFLDLSSSSHQGERRLSSLSGKKKIPQRETLSQRGEDPSSSSCLGEAPATSLKKKDPRVLLAGDALHTHSPKAGLGMNVSMADAFNLGWKLAAVLTGVADARILETYAQERMAIARELIDFDAGRARLLNERRLGRVDAGEVSESFMRHARYTTGVATKYASNLLVGDSTHQQLAAGFQIGTRFHSAPVVRICDARPLQLGHVVVADGRWRVFAFVDDADASSLDTLCTFLDASSNSPIRRYAPFPGADVDSVVDCVIVFRKAPEPEAVPNFFRPKTGTLKLVDYNKAFCADPSQDIFLKRKIATDCLVVVRPDQHVAAVFPLDAPSNLAHFFSAFLLEPSLGTTPCTNTPTPPLDDVAAAAPRNSNGGTVLAA